MNTICEYGDVVGIHCICQGFGNDFLHRVLRKALLLQYMQGNMIWGEWKHEEIVCEAYARKRV